MKPAKGSKQPKPWENAKAGAASDPFVDRFVQSLDADRRLYRHDIAGSIAHARMLESCGLISGQELAQIKGALEQIERQIDAAGDAWPGWKPHLEDVHMCLEAALIEMVGDAGRKLHTGRSRNDQVALDLKMWIKEACTTLDGVFDGVCRAFVTLAQRDGRIVMPSYTHWQRAQPIVVGGELMAWLSALDRAQRRLSVLWQTNRSNPLGSGAVAGTGLPIDRDHTAEALAVGPPAASSMDATSSRDAAIDFVYGLAMVAMTLSRWAEQWILYMSSEFRFLVLDPQHTTGSSMMPQKRNPDVLELIRGRCGGVYGQLVALLTICKGLGMGYQRDLQMDKRHVFDAYDSVLDCLEMTRRIVAGARFDGQAIGGTLEAGFLDATFLAEYLVEKGVPFRIAHQVVGGLVRRCEDEGLGSLAKLTVETINQACVATGAGAPCGTDVSQWLGSQNVVRCYRSAGNAGLGGFEQQLEAWRQRLDRNA